MTQLESGVELRFYHVLLLSVAAELLKEEFISHPELLWGGSISKSPGYIVLGGFSKSPGYTVLGGKG